MGGNDGDMRAAARRDPTFRGIDPEDLGRLIKQMREASATVTAWLGAHRPPPGVAATGYRQAAEAAQWADEQLGMLSRRHSYALTHPDTGDGIDVPPVPPRTRTPAGGAGSGGSRDHAAPAAPPPRRRTTPVGAGDDLGGFPTRPAAERQARADARAIDRAVRDGAAVPGSIWRHLAAHARDPDYTDALYTRLGPEATAGLISAAARDAGDRAARLAVIGKSIGMASHRADLDERWLRALLAAADAAGTREVTVDVLLSADLSDRSREALARIGVIAPIVSGPPKPAAAG